MVFTMKQKFVIIGAGPCGLGAAWELQKQNEDDFTVYESASFPGGLSSSHTDAFGCTWDIGGHVFHTAIPYAKEVFSLLMKEDEFTYARNAFVAIGHTLVPYPIQLHAAALPTVIRQRCLDELTMLEPGSQPATFHEWIIRSFGQTLADVFFLPYNRKMWTYPLDKISAPWVRTRIATLGDIKGKKRWGTNETFSVCRQGGIGEIWRRMAERLGSHIRYQKQVTGIDADAHIVTFADKTTVAYDHLLSTMPLTRLMSMIHTTKTLPSVDGLKSCGIASIGIGIRGPRPKDMKKSHWIYIPNPDVPFFRVSVYTNYSRAYAPNGVWTILAEVSYEPYRKPLPKDILQQTINGLQQMGYMTEKDTIVDTDVVLAPYAYPIPTPNRDEIVFRSISALADFHIASHGRFGSWKYETGNMDHAFMEGITWARDMKRAS